MTFLTKVRLQICIIWYIQLILSIFFIDIDFFKNLKDESLKDESLKSFMILQHPTEDSIKFYMMLLWILHSDSGFYIIRSGTRDIP